MSKSMQCNALYRISHSSVHSIALIMGGGANQKNIAKLTIIAVYDDVIHLYMYAVIHIYI